MEEEHPKREYAGKVFRIVEELVAPVCARHGLSLRRWDSGRAQALYYSSLVACLVITIDIIDPFYLTVLNIAGKGIWWENGARLTLDRGLKVFAPGVKADYTLGDIFDDRYLRDDLSTKLELIERYFPQVLDGDFSGIPDDCLS
ncbi:MAG TPA: hypothetical protein VGL56_03270 [Fimbriimonadaceae bacterium]|jgi:hypothetical protein